MSLVKFSTYAIPTVYPGMVSSKTDHVFVCSGDGTHNWNCFGRGCELINKSEELRELENASGSINSEWASLIYGSSFEGKTDGSPAAGIKERFNGVCHNAANRILVLAGDEVDVRAAFGSAFVTLVYGKFGYDIDAYVENVSNTAKTLKITDDEIEAVVKRITRGKSPEDEFDILKNDLDEHFGMHLSSLSDEERSKFDRIYGKFQGERVAAYTAEPQTGDCQEFQERFKKHLEPHLETCLRDLNALLGPDLFVAIFELPLEAAITTAKSFLLGI